MDAARTRHFENILHHVYINPLEKCNLKCRICYTKKTAPILTEGQIITFLDRYNAETDVKVVTFCGGEVNTLAYFPGLVNRLTRKGMFVQMITNGTVDRMAEYETPNSINMIVSVDGPEEHHDANRGTGRFRESIAYLKKARAMGFHTEVFTVVTKGNLGRLDEFESYLRSAIGDTDVTYHPRKPLEYLSLHPVSNAAGQIEGFGFLDPSDVLRLMETRTVFPPRELGCYQIALASDGTVYGCCEGYDKLGRMEDDPAILIANLKQRIAGPCLGCSQPSFMCGIRRIIESSKKTHGKS